MQAHSCNNDSQPTHSQKHEEFNKPNLKLPLHKESHLLPSSERPPKILTRRQASSQAPAKVWSIDCHPSTGNPQNNYAKKFTSLAPWNTFWVTCTLVTKLDCSNSINSFTRPKRVVSHRLSLLSLEKVDCTFSTKTTLYFSTLTICPNTSTSLGVRSHFGITSRSSAVAVSTKLEVLLPIPRLT